MLLGIVIYLSGFSNFFLFNFRNVYSNCNDPGSEDWATHALHLRL